MPELPYDPAVLGHDVADALVPALVLAAQVSAVAATAWMIAGRVDRERSLLDRWLIAVVAGVAEVCLLLQVLGTVHLLSRGPALVGVVAGVIVAWRTIGWPVRTRPRHLEGDAGTTTCVVAVVSFGCWAVVQSLRGHSAESDTTRYHAPVAAFAVHTHQLWRLAPVSPGAFENAYPSNFEFLAAWLMLPTGRDEVAYLVNVAAAGLCVLGTAVVARELGGRAWAGALLSTAVLASPIVLFTQIDSLMNDAGAAGALMAALAFVLHWRREPRRGVWAALAGVALGLAVGTKYTALLPSLGVVIFAVLVVRGCSRRAVAVLAASTAALTMLWFVRAAAATGNPLFPLDLQVGGRTVLTGADSPRTAFDTNLATHLVQRHWTPMRTWARQALDGYGPALLIVVTGVIGGLARPGRRLVFLVAGLAAATGVAYLVTPYTGGGPDGVTFLIASQLRYALPTALFGAAVAATFSTRAVLLLAAPTLAYAFWQSFSVPGYRPDLDVGPAFLGGWLSLTIAVIAATLLVARLPAEGHRAVPPVARPVLAVAAVAVCVVAFAVLPPERPSTVEGVLAAQHRPRGPVAMVDVENVRSLMGRDFEVDLLGAGDGGVDGERPILDSSALDRRIAELAPAVVAVGRVASPSRPPGWTGPSGWTVAATDRSLVYLVPPDAGGP